MSLNQNRHQKIQPFNQKKQIKKIETRLPNLQQQKFIKIFLLNLKTDRKAHIINNKLKIRVVNPMFPVQ